MLSQAFKFFYSLRVGYSAFRDTLSTPDNVLDGEALENEVRQNFITKQSFDLLYQTNSFDKTDFNHSLTLPDYQFRQKSSGYVFFVEVKSRTPYDGKVKWSYDAQLERYRSADKNSPVYLFLEVLNSNPVYYFIPLFKIKYPYLRLEYYSSFMVNSELDISKILFRNKK